MLSLALPIINGGVLLAGHKYDSRSFSGYKWGSRGEHDLRLFSGGKRSHTIRVLANPNVSSSDKERSKNEVVMVDPVEAKRLAAKQMEQIKAKERFKKRRQIEAINGVWAMVGLTAGLVIEGHTGNTILSQLAGYWAAFFGLFG